MSRPHILMTGSYPETDMAALDAYYIVHRLWEATDRHGYLAVHGRNIRAIATRGELGASSALMEALPDLEIVSCYGVGTDAIDLGFARSRGICVTNTPDVLTEDVADLGMALLLAAARQTVAGDAHVRRGLWIQGALALTTRVWGKRVGVVGMGRIGQAFAQRAAAFGCVISYFARAPKPGIGHRFVDNLVDLAASCDFLVVTLAGGEATRGIVSADVIAALGPDGILVNISRGTTVDEEALLAALETGAIRSAGLDVFLNEPVIDARFSRLPNVVLQPHHGSGTVETRGAMGQLVRDNLDAHFSGAPLLTPVA